MEEIKLIYIIMGMIAFVIPFIGHYYWTKFELKQVRKDSEKNDDMIEEKRAINVKALREIYDQKIMESRSYAKGLFEQRSDSINNLQKKVDKIEVKLDSMATQKSIDRLERNIASLSSMVIKHMSEDD